MGLSQHSTMPLEDVAAAAPKCPRWYQLYILKDRALTADIVRRCDSCCAVSFYNSLRSEIVALVVKCFFLLLCILDLLHVVVGKL